MTIEGKGRFEEPIFIPPPPPSEGQAPYQPLKQISDAINKKVLPPDIVAKLEKSKVERGKTPEREHSATEKTESKEFFKHLGELETGIGNSFLWTTECVPDAVGSDVLPIQTGKYYSAIVHEVFRKGFF